MYISEGFGEEVEVNPGVPDYVHTKWGGRLLFPRLRKSGSLIPKHAFYYMHYSVCTGGIYFCAVQ